MYQRIMQGWKRVKKDVFRMTYPDTPASRSSGASQPIVYQNIADDSDIRIVDENTHVYVQVLASDPPVSDESAIALYQRTLDEQLRALGEDHPDTLAARNSLAVAYAAAEDLERAIPLLVRALEDTRRVLGDAHPLTRIVKENLEECVEEVEKGGSQ